MTLTDILTMSLCSHVPCGVPVHMYCVVSLFTCTMWCPCSHVPCGVPVHMYRVVSLFTCTVWCPCSHVPCDVPVQDMILPIGSWKGSPQGFCTSHHLGMAVKELVFWRNIVGEKVGSLCTSTYQGEERVRVN